MPPERKFTQRSRLFIGNLPLDMTEEEFKKLFTSYGEIAETFVNKEKGFGFVRLDTRANAEKAKWELDGTLLRNRQLRVRFATHGAALSVKNLSVHVSNELLEEAFSQFGQVERAVVIVDDRGRSTERGIVEFARKSSATKALQQIREGCFLLTTSPRAVAATPLEQEDSEDGLPEKNIQRGPPYHQEREAPPRFAQPGTFEEEFARRWKALDDLEKQQREQLEKNMHDAKEKLEGEMENAIHEHRNRLMKEDLIRRQEELQRLEEARKRELDRRQHLELAREEARTKELDDMQRRQDLLRAQIDGNYRPDPHGLGLGRALPRHGQGFERSVSPRTQGLFQDVLAQEMMAGQGGLGPAPKNVTKKKVYHNTLSNIKKKLGCVDKNLCATDQVFYSVILQDDSPCQCEKEALEQMQDMHIQSPKTAKFKKLTSCPEVLSCQSFKQWKSTMSMNFFNRFLDGMKFQVDRLKLYFLPIGPFPDCINSFQLKGTGMTLIQGLCEFLRIFFNGCEIVLLPMLDISSFPCKKRKHCSTGKEQYLVGDFFPKLKSMLPKDGFGIVALSWHDLYPSDDLNFVLGQANANYYSCVASFGRFDPTYVKGFQGRKNGIAVEEIQDIKKVGGKLIWKLMKVLAHETCHVFGVLHCWSYECLMNESHSSAEALQQPLILCPLCMKKIQNALSRWPKTKNLFQIEKHLASLAKFLKAVLAEETELTEGKKTCEWIEDMLKLMMAVPSVQL
ncbi:uncharacterized protein LOC143464550 isoform X2 [Clavelina lepadiformis]